MKKNKDVQGKGLVLIREALRNLKEGALTAAVGGEAPSYTPSCKNCHDH